MPAWDKYEYKPGLIFYSKYAACQFPARSRKEIKAQDGTVIDIIPELLLEFAYHGGEYSYESPDGTTDVAADIRGHFADLDYQADEKGWTDEERALVAKRALWWSDYRPEDFRLYTTAPLPAPWPTYDKTHHSKIGNFAEEGGLIAEALAYEQQNKKRESVVSDLKARLAKQVEEQIDEDALTAA